MIDPTVEHRIRQAIANPYRWNQRGKPTIEQALVEFVWAVEGRDVSPDIVVACIAAMTDYMRCRVVARIWRRYQPDLTSSIVDSDYERSLSAT